MIKMIETFINRALALDPRTKTRLEALQGKIAKIVILDLNIQVVASFNERGISLELLSQDNLECEYDVTISAPLVSFICLLITKDRHRATTLGLSVTGDSQTAENSQTLGLDFEIDWEELLSRFTGDVISHRIARLIKQFKQGSRDALDSFSKSLADYLQEESKILPPKDAVDYFLDAVDEAGKAADRLEARIARLEHPLEKDI